MCSPHEDNPTLTPHERQILAELARGRTAIEAAERLGMRPSAFNRQLQSAREKTGAQNNVHAARLFRDSGPPPEG